MSSSQRSSRSRASHRGRVRLHLLWAWIGGVLVISFSVFHGISSSDLFYLTELSMAWVVGALGLYSGIYALKRGHRKQRVLATIALALIVSSLAVVTLLNRIPDPMSTPVRPAEVGE